MNRPHSRSHAWVPVVLVVTLALLWVVEFLWASHYKPVFPWHSVTGYMAVIGLAGCALLALAAKFIGKKYLQRPAPAEHRSEADANLPNLSGGPHDRA